MKLKLTLLLLLVLGIIILKVDDNNYSVLLDDKIIETNYIIPKIIFQTYHTKTKIPTYVIENTKNYAKTYNINILDDIDGLQFLKQYYTHDVVNKYDSLKGPHKADLLRYCLLYIHGGVYADIKTVFIKDLENIINNTKNNNHKIYTVNSYIGGTTYQGFIATTPRNPLFLNLIKHILNTPILRTYIDYLVFCRYIDTELKNVKDQDIILFNEICTSDSDKKDKYGLYCKINDNDDTHIIDTRDPNYPY